MQIASRFAIATHILAYLGTQPEEATSSERLAASIGANPVIVRNILAMLKRHDIVMTRRGVAGAKLCKPLFETSLLEVYRAVGSDKELFSLHEHPHPDCPVGSKIHDALLHNFHEAQLAMEASLGSRTMEDIVKEMGLGGK